jgi:isopentenyldiphosphate isomerase
MSENIGHGPDAENFDAPMSEIELNTNVSMIVRALAREFGIKDLTNHEFLRLYYYAKQFMNNELDHMLKYKNDETLSRDQLIFNVLTESSDKILYAWFNDICEIDYADLNKIQKKLRAGEADVAMQKYVNLLRSNKETGTQNNFLETKHIPNAEE